MDATSKFFGDELIDHPVAGNTRLASKSIGNDQNAKMTFAGSRGGPVTCMHFAFIYDVKTDGVQSNHYFFT